jgi:hypothetical protein
MGEPDVRVDADTRHDQRLHAGVEREDEHPRREDLEVAHDGHQQVGDVEDR